MQMSSLKPASALAKRYGVKASIYGPPGSGKTPLISTAPRPVLLSIEPGLLSMRHSNVPTFEAHDVATIKEFFDWFFKSAETKNFDTLAIDSGSHLAELFLADAMKRVKHGMKAYGEMSDNVMEIFNKLYYLENKNIVVLCKEGAIENGRQTVNVGGEIVFEPVMQKRPFFPGKDLMIKFPHLFDSIWHLNLATIPGQPKPVSALRTKATPEVFARDRIGTLNELEFPDLTAIFAKSQ